MNRARDLPFTHSLSRSAIFSQSATSRTVKLWLCVECPSLNKTKSQRSKKDEYE